MCVLAVLQLMPDLISPMNPLETLEERKRAFELPDGRAPGSSGAGQSGGMQHHPQHQHQQRVQGASEQLPPLQLGPLRAQPPAGMQDAGPLQGMHAMPQLHPSAQPRPNPHMLQAGGPSFASARSFNPPARLQLPAHAAAGDTPTHSPLPGYHAGEAGRPLTAVLCMPVQPHLNPTLAMSV